MLAAIVGLIGAVIGGALVVMGDGIARRAERRASRVDQLRHAAADVIASYLTARSHLIARHRHGRQVDQFDIYPHERQLAFARLFTLPGAEALTSNLRAIAKVTSELAEARDGESFDRSASRQLDEIRKMEASVRQIVFRQ